MSRTLIQLAGLIALTGCTVGGSRAIGKTTCERRIEQLCDICPKNEGQERSCTCIAEGTLTPDDFPEGFDLSRDEAQQVCDQILIGQRFPTDAGAAGCKQDLEYLQEWEVDACEDLGWVDPDDGGDTD